MVKSIKPLKDAGRKPGIHDGMPPVKRSKVKWLIIWLLTPENQYFNKKVTASLTKAKRFQVRLPVEFRQVCSN